MQHLLDVRVDGPRRRYGVDVAVRHLDQAALGGRRRRRPRRPGRPHHAGGLLRRAIAPDVPQRGVVRRWQVPDRRVGPRHLERREDPFADQIVPRASGAPLDQVPRGQEHQILVLPAAAERRARLEVLEAAVQLLAVEASAVPQPVVPRQSRTVRHQVARRHLAGGEVVVQLKVGEVGAHGLVPLELAGIRQHAHQHDGERLRVGPDGHEGPRRHGEALFDVAVAVTLEEDGLPILNHAEGEPRDLPFFHHPGDEVIEPAEGAVAGNRGPARGRSWGAGLADQCRRGLQREEQQGGPAHPGPRHWVPPGARAVYLSEHREGYTRKRSTRARARD